MPHASHIVSVITGVLLQGTLLGALSALAAPGADDIDVFPLPTEGHRPQAIAVGPDGNLWVTEVLMHEIVRVTPQGVLSEFPIPGQGVGVIQGIAAGSDGAMWFTSREENSIRRITVDGEFAGSFAIPSRASAKNEVTPGSWPRVIAGIGTGSGDTRGGGDSPLWFAEMAANRIASISATGGITEHELPNPESKPYGVACGADHGVWFTESARNAIGRLDIASGVISEFPIPTADSFPRDIAAGPDGNLWFAENKSGRIGRITPAGAISEFPIPTAGAQPIGIAAGPDGCMWFCEFKVGRIGRMTADGQVTEFVLATPDAKPFGICAGPDGNMWVALQANAIARIRVAKR